MSSIKYVIKKIWFRVHHLDKYLRDLLFDTRLSSCLRPITNSFIKIDELNLTGLDDHVVNYICHMYCSHRFNLLGSGWVTNSYNSISLGLEIYCYNMNVNVNKFDRDGLWLKKILFPTHLKSSQEIWKNVSNDYTPIDWQKDFKSGYRYSQRSWYNDQKICPKPGVDIKIPWELSRLQHLPQMAIFALKIPNLKNKLIKEFRNQSLDFIATNPPRMGVNWASTMDVSIRVANMLVAYDIFCQLDEDDILDHGFKQIFTNSVYEHGRHIINNLENKDLLKSNHYLSNIAGLSFASAYLDSTEEIDNWLALSLREITTEFSYQFYEDGTNFEASTSYHRLSAEIVTFTTALFLALNNAKKESLLNRKPEGNYFTLEVMGRNTTEKNIESEKLFPDWYYERLLKSGLFTVQLTKPTGEIQQIGDNDSGRFFRFSPNGNFLTMNEAIKKYRNLKGYDSLTNGEDLYWDENDLNHSTFLSAIGGLFALEDFNRFMKIHPFESSLIRSLVKHPIEIAAKNNEILLPLIGNEPNIDSELLSYFHKTVFEPKEKKNASFTRGLRSILYPDSGIYMIISDRLHLTISFGSIGQNGSGGHAHNDKLAFTLNIDGEDIVLDPGTYIYSPLLSRRNEFRSVKAHHTIVIEGVEQNDWKEGLSGIFQLSDETKCNIVYANGRKFIFRVTYKDVIHLRIFKIQDYKLIIDDYCNKDFSINTKYNFYSNGYGKLLDV